MAFAPANSAEPVIYRYPQRLDTFHRPIPGTGVDLVVEDCVFAPGAGRENEVHANQVLADGTVFAPPDAPAITAHDQVVIRGEVYDIIERPRYWINEVWEIPVRRVTG